MGRRKLSPKNKRTKYKQDWYYAHKEETVKKDAAKHILQPWVRTYYLAKNRCRHWKTYKANGIQSLLTKDDCKFLWFRDAAYDLKIPSIDRIDNNKNYELNNCRYIEKSENTKKGNKSL